ncbi:hypothetical protein IEQ34_007951 [Dendrobium chrysotoxum]|uniref:Uncharacterized protein n=1 Tax=Dendrobium chrysotoxum TaxID=161865 RepID=A0AAV7H6T7_DENCH|nr:hypothetical protein IEQ34_007951 [Dendrobium chrysotoxum]
MKPTTDNKESTSTICREDKQTFKRNFSLVNAFPREITEAKPLAKCKIPHLDSYKGKTDLIDNVNCLEWIVSLLDINNALKCRLFFTTFKESPLWWF